jgi:hypothetical protein
VNSAEAALGQAFAVGARPARLPSRSSSNVAHLGLLVLGREQLVERLVTLVDQIGDVLLQLHHEVGNLARDGHRIHEDGLRKPSGFLEGGHRRTYQQTDPIWCSCHGPQITGDRLAGLGR